MKCHPVVIQLWSWWELMHIRFLLYYIIRFAGELDDWLGEKHGGTLDWSPVKRSKHELIIPFVYFVCDCLECLIWCPVHNVSSLCFVSATPKSLRVNTVRHLFSSGLWAYYDWGFVRPRDKDAPVVYSGAGNHSALVSQCLTYFPSHPSNNRVTSR